MIFSSTMERRSVMIEVLRSWVTGPLESYAPGFAAELARRGRAARDCDPVVLARWLEQVTWPAAPRLASLRAPVLVAPAAGDEAAAGLRLAG